MAFYGNNEHPPDALVPDWLMGGNRKRRVIAALAHPPRGGWTVMALVEDLECGRTTAFEIVRGLRALGVLETTRRGGLRLATGPPLAKAIKAMIEALDPYDGTAVDRPPRARDVPAS